MSDSVVGGGSSASSAGGAGRRGLRVRMTARDVSEPHRVSTQLELLFDLTFVVAIASIANAFAHAIIDGHALSTLAPFLEVFFAIWWAWMNFTWFASSYDTDDALYRILTLVQMGGVLVLAAGVPSAFENGDFLAVTLGYAIMRVGLIAQWLRAAREHPARRATALRYAGGIAAVQLGWLLRLALAEAGLIPDTLQVAVFGLLALCELLVPIWAERKGATSWHPHHIAERYGLFTIILLGESVLAASTGLGTALEAGGLSGSLVTIAVAGLVLLFALWWLYFLEPAGEGLAGHRERSYYWGYLHYGIFAALTALGAGLEVAVEQTGHHDAEEALAPWMVGMAVAIPVAVFLVLLWAAHAPLVERARISPPLTIGAAVVVLLLPLLAGLVGTPATIVLIAGVCALVVARTVTAPRVYSPE